MNCGSEIMYRILKPIIYIIFKILYMPEAVNKENIPSEGATIIVGNHRHAFDPLLIGMSTKRPVTFLAKKELHQGLKKIFFKSVGTIPIDLNNKNKEASDTALEVLKEDKVIGLFPEGKRNRTNDLLLPFKYGAVSLARKSNAVIVPSGIIGEYRLFRKGIKIIFGEPINVNDMEITKANEYLEEKVRYILENN